MSNSSNALVDPDWLEARLDDANTRIIALNFTDSVNYDQAHIPGAIFWNWKEMLWDPDIRNFPTPETFAERCSAAGIGNDTTSYSMAIHRCSSAPMPGGCSNIADTKTPMCSMAQKSVGKTRGGP